MSTDEIAGAVAVLRGAVDRLLEMDLDVLDGVGVVGLLEGLEVQRRRLDAVDARVLNAATACGAAGEYARTSTAELLTHVLQVAPGAARDRVQRATDLGPRRTLGGQPLEAIHPILAAAQRAGAISAPQIAVITRMLGRIPLDISVEATPVAEACLVQAARFENPKQLTDTATALLARLDQDGKEPDEEKVYRRREFTLTRDPDGSWRPRGTLTDECGLAWSTILDSLSRPAPATADPVATEGNEGGGQGEPDARTAPERRHDALFEAGQRLLRSATLPDAGGAPVTILVRTTPADLADPNGIVQSERGNLMRTRTLTRLAGDAELIPLLFDPSHTDQYLRLGRTHRLANRAQRRALAARDGGCTFPGCDRPSSWTEVHHVVPWQEGGRTDLENLCLLCPHHHREFRHRGWSVRITDGRAAWTPPQFIDPHRRPQHNRAHHLPHIQFHPDGVITAHRQ